MSDEQDKFLDALSAFDDISQEEKKEEKEEKPSKKKKGKPRPAQTPPPEESEELDPDLFFAPNPEARKKREEERVRLGEEAVHEVPAEEVEKEKTEEDLYPELPETEDEEGELEEILPPSLYETSEVESGGEEDVLFQDDDGDDLYSPVIIEEPASQATEDTEEKPVPKTVSTEVERVPGAVYWSPVILATEDLIPEAPSSPDLMSVIRQDFAYESSSAREKEQPVVEEGKEVPGEEPKDEDSIFTDLKNVDWSTLIKSNFGAVSTLKYAAAALVFALVAWLAISATNLPGLGGDKHYVHFTARINSARTVSIVGDFNNWTPEITPMEKLPNSSVWETWVPLEPGQRYRYGFIIDGRRHYIEPGRPMDTHEGRGVSVIYIPSGGGPPVMAGGPERAGTPNVP